MSRLAGEPPDDIDPQISQLEAELARPATYREPSAAERALQAKPVQPARRMGWRGARKARKLRKPVAGPSGRPAQRARSAPPSRPRPHHGQRGRVLRYTAGAAILVVVGVAAYYVVPRLSAGRNDQTPVLGGSKPPVAPAATVTAPFLGSPAQSYAGGAAGIVLPPAQPVGSYTAAQVAAAYQRTKQMLVAANLDGRTLAGGAPDAFASLLIPDQRTQFVSGLDRTGLNPQGFQYSTRSWVTSFAPGTQLAGNVIKVHGFMNALTATNAGTPVLRIHADYLFVYPVQRPGQPSTLARIVNRDVVNVDFGAYGEPGMALEPWWSVVGGGESGARCDVNDGFVHPQFPGGPPDKVTPKGTPINPYDQRATAPDTGACHATGGT